MLEDPLPPRPIYLITAIEKGFTPIVARLMKDPRIDPSWMRQKPLRTAIRELNEELIKLLLTDSRVEFNRYCEKTEFLFKYETERSESLSRVKTLLIQHPRTPPEFMFKMAITSTDSGLMELVLNDCRYSLTLFDYQQLRQWKSLEQLRVHHPKCVEFRKRSAWIYYNDYNGSDND